MPKQIPLRNFCSFINGSSYCPDIVNQYILNSASLLEWTCSLDFTYINFVTGSAKRGLIADPNLTYLETRNLTCEFGTTLKLCLNVPLAYHYCLV